MTSFLRHEYAGPTLPAAAVVNEQCRYSFMQGHDSVADYGNSLDQCRYYGNDTIRYEMMLL